MKKLLLLFVLLILVGGCGVTKHKQKGKTQTELEEGLKTIEKTDVKENITSQKRVSDSINSISNYAVDRSKAATLQNFSLKNNGRCTDPGTIRYLNFTDALGNKTSIPVNDNTDLNFNSETEFKKEIETLKIEITNLKKENETLKKENKTLTAKEVDKKSKINTKTSNTKTETEKRSFWAFILVGVLSIVVWEIIRRKFK
ncbi:hypothetical protein [Chryseobacterium oncorhynchi]|uniref:Lipoprotein n=1 Tax=Chryseobacterium oncorhynchi TaxID=741074 RepID=A0A316WLK6_9FLAO|nr:hypothetical protein [Chryseobacterium oncorhynchi]PWN62322.1 hypothetical protein C1638_017675 [Chryseobacterium oncorhynchi]